MLDIRNKETVDIAKQMFNTLHEVEEVDQFLEKGKEYFVRKYNIDYFSVHMLHHKRSNFIGFYNHDTWHNYLYSHGHGANHKDEFFIKLLPNIGKNQIYFEYMNSYVQERKMNMRAEMIGVRKYSGVTLIASDELNNITVYDITFKDDVNFSTLDKKVLHNLVQDFIRYKSLLLPFINHADQFGSFSDKRILHKSMSEFVDANQHMFNF